jgi:hypothetical protein
VTVEGAECGPEPRKISILDRMGKSGDVNSSNVVHKPPITIVATIHTQKRILLYLSIGSPF